nr:endo-1,4-beta-xylanase [Glycomyces amatae]
MLTRKRRRAVIAGVVTVATAALGIGLSTQFASAQTTLRGAADELGIDIGVAVNDSLLQNNQAYRDLIAREFNSVTAENGMKMESVQPSQGSFNFSQGDRLVAFAQQNDMTVHGHTLVWHNQSPGWIQNLSGTAMRQAMENHITTTMNHWEGDVATWDVVNEVVSDSNGQMRDSFWLRAMGEDYIQWAFEAARAADPGADLYMNDYSIDGINAKSDRYYQMAQELVAQDLLDGMGFQAHLILGQVPGNMEQNLQRFVDLGLKVRITELDIRIEMPATQQELEQQAQDFQRVTEICAGLADCSGVTVWGVRDGDSWVPGVFPGYGAPLLFNDSNQPKPAYYGALEGLGGDGSEEPPTTEEPTTTPPPTGDGDCTAEIDVVNDWGSGWQGNVLITADSGAVNGWTLNWTWPSGQSITSSWNAQVSSSGSSVTASDVGWNANIAAGQTVNAWGFVGSGSSASPQVTCTAA